MGKTQIFHLNVQCKLICKTTAFFHIWNPNINSFIDYLHTRFEQLKPKLWPIRNMSCGVGRLDWAIVNILQKHKKKKKLLYGSGTGRNDQFACLHTNNAQCDKEGRVSIEIHQFIQNYKWRDYGDEIWVRGASFSTIFEMSTDDSMK